VQVYIALLKELDPKALAQPFDGVEKLKDTAPSATNAQVTASNTTVTVASAVVGTKTDPMEID